jgi:hypothetical protein
MDGLGLVRIGRSEHVKEMRFDTLFVHRISVPILLLGFFVACALLSSSTLNPFLYFRF